MFILFACFGYYGYKYVVARQANKFKNVANVNNRGLPIDVYMFSADWCPHCKAAKPDWMAFCDEYDGQEINGFTVTCHTIDCTDDPLPSSVQTLCDKYNKERQFPTVTLVKNGQTIDFDAKITKSSLEQFIVTLANV